MDFEHGSRDDLNDGGDVGEGEARCELERILADPEFHCTERNRKFLRFVSEELFAGRGASVKAYVIAVDVFGRATSFDPGTDPIVRIEATRLRAALTRYYQEQGQALAVRIDLPRGRYVPVFAHQKPQTPVAAPSSPELPDRPSAEKNRPHTATGILRRSWMAGVLGLAGGLLLGAASGWFYWTDKSGPAFSYKPMLSIDMRPSPGTSEEQATAFRDALVVAVSGFQAIRLNAQQDATASVGMAATARRPDGIQRAYELQIKYSADGDSRTAWWQLVDEATGEALRSGAESVKAADSEPPSQELASKLAVRLAWGRGVINTVETERELDSPTLGNGCILRSIVLLNEGGLDGLAASRTCLERTLVARPNDADANAMLAAILLKMDGAEASPGLVDHALDSAERAVALAPDSDRGYYTLMMAQYRKGNAAAAIRAGRRAHGLNPYNPMTTGMLARILFVTGQWEEALTLVRHSQNLGMLTSDGDATLAYDAYRQGRFEKSLLLIQEVGPTDCCCLQLLRVAALGELGRRDDAAAAMAELRRSHPQLPSPLGSYLERLEFARPLVALLRPGLEKAGVKIL